MSPKRVLDPAWRAYARRAYLALRPWNQHSLVLVTLGSIYGCLGLLWMLTPAPASRRASLVLLLHLTGGSMVPLGLAWVLVGFGALLSARWPPANYRWGYIAMGMLTSFWAAAAVLGWAVYGTTWYISVGSALIYTGLTVLVIGISGLTAPVLPPATPPVVPEGPPGEEN